jgi:hypothetical protein
MGFIVLLLAQVVFYWAGYHFWGPPPLGLVLFMVPIFSLAAFGLGLLCVQEEEVEVAPDDDEDLFT